MLVRLAISFIENPASSSSNTAFTASMFVSVIEVYGLPERVPSLRHDSPLSNTFSELRTVRKETTLVPQYDKVHHILTLRLYSA